MNKGKIVSLSIGLLLLAGGGILGSKALFTDNKNVNNDLVITTGTFELEVDNDLPWKIISEDGTEITNQTASNNFANVRPGDKFRKIVEVTNNGSLTQLLTVKENTQSKENPYKDIFEVTNNALQNINNKTLAPGESIDMSITIATKPELMENGKQNTNIKFNEIIDPIVIEANQVNHKTINKKVIEGN